MRSAHIEPSAEALQEEGPADIKRGRASARRKPPAKRNQQKAAAASVQCISGPSIEQLHEAAARFEQATLELQLLGMIRPGRQRNAQHAERIIFHFGASS